MSGVAADARHWARRRERGALPLIRLMVWLSLRLGRPGALLLLYPVCAYYFLFAAAPGRASRDYLARILGRPPRLGERWRHLWCFAVCLLDRVLLLNDRLDRFDIALHGAELAEQGGALLFGAHLGSFEVIRAAGRRRAGLRLALVMYEQNARKTNAVLHAINPDLAQEIIALGRPRSMITVKDRLDAGYLVGLLADRGLGAERMERVGFLGAPAAFPLGPFRMALLLRRPVVLMVGLFAGGARYDIHFELLAAAPAAPVSGAALEAAAIELLHRYVARIEHYCRLAPCNWFNFYDFWA